MKKIFFFILICLWSVGVYAETKSFNMGKTTDHKKIRLEMTNAQFLAANFKIEYKIVQVRTYKRAGASCEGKVCKMPVKLYTSINDKRIFGVMNDMLPRTYLQSMTLSVGEKRYKLDSSQMYNIRLKHRVNSASGQCFQYIKAVCSDELNCRIKGAFSDAAASFRAEWIVKNGSARRVYIDQTFGNRRLGLPSKCDNY